MSRAVVTLRVRIRFTFHDLACSPSHLHRHLLDSAAWSAPNSPQKRIASSCGSDSQVTPVASSAPSGESFAGTSWPKTLELSRPLSSIFRRLTQSGRKGGGASGAGSGAGAGNGVVDGLGLGSSTGAGASSFERVGLAGGLFSGGGLLASESSAATGT